ncbi:MAG: adenylate kinase family protein [Candidatus Thermoplasmatota archaeon]|nr:adenylate kinase family protein [Candidatus Thermoplasmatota archaeon]MDI6887847.1 adenylate kinase family protein [Candidatus Thermoplasmatota archaeon]
MRIALTGVPCVGKSAVAKVLRKRSYRVVNLNILAERHNFIKGYDRARNCKIVDLKKLEALIEQKFSQKKIFLVSHFAHLLNNDITIILRCSPKELKKRLVRKGYSRRKVIENLEAEALGVITLESAHRNKNTYEIDSTKLSKEEIANKIILITKGKGKCYEAGKIDWSEEILEWY